MLHLMKLAVGVRSFEDLGRRMRDRCGADGLAAIRTRQTPRRADELAGGSMYWVVAGLLTARQPIRRVEAVRDETGARSTLIGLDPVPVAVRPRAVRAFQGWRYLDAGDAPADAGSAGALGEEDEMPRELRRRLVELCLL